MGDGRWEMGAEKEKLRSSSLAVAFRLGVSVAGEMRVHPE